MPPKTSPAQPVSPATAEQVFRAFYAKAVRAAELARAAGAGTGRWPQVRPQPSGREPLGSAR